MAPVKQVGQNKHQHQHKKKRTFFSSKLDISLPKSSQINKNVVTDRNDENANIKISSKVILGALEGLSNEKKEVKQIKVYTLKSKSTSRAMMHAKPIKKSTENTSIAKSKPVRSVIVDNDDKTTKKDKEINKITTKVKVMKPSIPLTRAKVRSSKGIATRSKIKPKINTITVKSSKQVKSISSKPVTITKATKTTITKSTASSNPSSSKSMKSKSKSKSESITNVISPSNSQNQSASSSSVNDNSGTSTLMTIDKSVKKDKPLRKEYMTAGFYCQDPHPSSSKQLHNKILSIRSAETKSENSKSQLRSKSISPAVNRNTRNKSQSSQKQPPPPLASEVIQRERPSFPPLPYDHGYELFFGEQHEFQLPYYILKEKEDGKLDQTKKPKPYQKLRSNVYPERSKVSADFTAICKCSRESKCQDQCINRIMSYLCGKECQSGDDCTNKTLTKRRTVPYKVVYTGERGFGIVVTEDVKEGDFVMDYRGEVISMETFMDRIEDEYKGTKNFYALAYDQDEVIDAGMKGNDARFINHGCAPNLEVRKYQTAGDGWEEFEVGMWALRDIKAGEELFYDYNFESFGVAAQSDELRTKCCCGAPNCVKYLGRKLGEKTAKELAAELAIKAAEVANKGKKSKSTTKKITKPTSSSRDVTKRLSHAQSGTAVLGLENDIATTGTVLPPEDISSDLTSVSSMDISFEISTPSENPSAIPQPRLEPATTSVSPISATSDDVGLSSSKKRKSEVVNPIIDMPSKKSRKSEPAPAPQGEINNSIKTSLKKKSRKSEPAPDNVTTSETPIRNKNKNSRKSEGIALMTKSPMKKKSRKSEPLPTTQPTTQVSKEIRRNPRISMDAVREAARIKKAENVKARKGAPKGWVILPVTQPLQSQHQVPINPGQPVIQGRRPPRDRSSLG